MNAADELILKNEGVEQDYDLTVEAFCDIENELTEGELEVLFEAFRLLNEYESDFSNPKAHGYLYGSLIFSNYSYDCRKEHSFLLDMVRDQKEVWE